MLRTRPTRRMWRKPPSEASRPDLSSLDASRLPPATPAAARGGIITRAMATTATMRRGAKYSEVGRVREMLAVHITSVFGPPSGRGGDDGGRGRARRGARAVQVPTMPGVLPRRVLARQAQDSAQEGGHRAGARTRRGPTATGKWPYRMAGHRWDEVGRGTSAGDADAEGHQLALDAHASRPHA